MCPLRFVSPTDVCWQDDAGVVCGVGRLLPQPLQALYPRTHQLFVRVAGVPEAPSATQLLRALTKARDAQDAQWAWACLAQVGYSLLQTNSASARDAHAEADTPGPLPEEPRGAAGQQAGQQEQTVHWSDVLATQALLPATEGSWVSAATGAVFVHWGSEARAWETAGTATSGPFEGSSGSCCSIRNEISEEEVKELTAAARGSGTVLHVLCPAEGLGSGGNSEEQGAAASKDQKVKPTSMQGSNRRQLAPTTAAPGAGTSSSTYASLAYLLTSVLCLPDLARAVIRAPADAAAQPIPSANLQRDSLPFGASLLTGVMQQLTHMLPFVLRYLHAHHSRWVLDAALLQQLGSIVQSLRVIAAPGLQKMLVIQDLGVATDAKASHAMLDIRDAAETGGAACSLLVSLPLDAAETDLGLSAWRSLLGEFVRLFTGGSVDQGLASMLLVLHSVRGQPPAEIEATIETMCQLPAADGAVAELLAATPFGEVGAAWNKSPAHGPHVSAGRAGPGEEEEEEEEEGEVIVWGGAKQSQQQRPAQAPTDLPDAATAADPAAAAGPSDTFDQTAGTEGQAGTVDQAVDQQQQGLGRQGQDAAGGARAMRQLLSGHRPAGTFVEEEVQVCGW